MKFAALLGLTSVALALAGCGGGEGGGPSYEITALAPPVYSKAATFAVTGSDLQTRELTVGTAGCKGLAQAPGSTAQELRVTCTVTVAGSLQVDLKTAAGEVLVSRSFTVPAPEVEMQTSLGLLKLAFYPDKAPATVLNFFSYVNAGFYDGTLFHRVVPGFVVQGGGFTSGLVAKPNTTAPIALETPNGLSNVRGTLAMARTSVPNSATSQFYVNLQDNLGLDYASASAPGYAVFGVVKEGMAVIDAIAAVPTTSSVPQAEVVITRAVQTR
ncbi:MAG: peptidylprolyl isomerase [Burkholderiaceae bacterium]|nr:peptidylprolyl isomerase [Burkholderiaceae bacterium]